MKKYQLLVIWLFLGLGALFIHGEPPTHYFVPLYPIPAILAALVLAKINKYLAGVILGLLAWINLNFFFSDKWFYKKQVITSAQAPYQEQLKVAKTITKEAAGRPFSLSRVGPNDHFEGNYADNYRYLLWWLGDEPKKNQDLRFTIYEDVENQNVSYRAD